MQHCVPVGWEKDIKEGYLKLTSDKELKADIQIIVPSKGKWHSSCSAFRSLLAFDFLTFSSLAGSENYIFCCKLDYFHQNQVCYTYLCKIKKWF